MYVFACINYIVPPAHSSTWNAPERAGMKDVMSVELELSLVELCSGWWLSSWSSSSTSLSRLAASQAMCVNVYM